MKIYFFRLITLMFLTTGLLSCYPSHSAIKLPALIGNNMVLQQNTNINVWGWAEAGEKIQVKANWTSDTLTTITNKEGKWTTILKTPVAGGAYTMLIKGGDYSITIENIMIGEVWVCSGQSNMEFTMRGLGGWKHYKPEVCKDVAKGNYNDVRLFTVKKDTAAMPLADCKGRWSVADTTTVNDFSATAWFFGSYLSKKLGVPVGLISSAWGGTPAEVWAPAASIDANPDLGFYRTHFNGSPWWPGTPGVLYNAMIHPLQDYIIKGVIWYQGESNRNDARLYPELMKTLITSWRKSWNVGDFPFYYVQIAPYLYDELFTGALLREAQLKCLSIPGTGMAITSDIAGDINDIHPKNKLDVGNRLALWALNNTYKSKVESFSGPIYKDSKTEGNKIIITFHYADGGLKLSKDAKNNFIVAAADHVFYPANVKIIGSSMELWSPKVKTPQAARYAFTNIAEATLFNSSGLPASSFRTDNWDIITENAVLKPFVDPITRGLSYQLTCHARETDIYYDFNKLPTKTSPIFRSSIPTGKTGTLNTCVARNGFLSETTQSWSIVANKAMNADIKYNSPFSQQYAAGGNIALLDGIIATTNYQDGSWQGFDGNDLDVEIDLGKPISAKTVICHFLSDNHSWIFLPKYVKTSVSEDGKTFTNLGENSFSNEQTTKEKMIQAVSFPVKSKIRYIKLTATNQAVCPSWHEGAGKKAWLFVDEIVVE